MPKPLWTLQAAALAALAVFSAAATSAEYSIEPILSTSGDRTVPTSIASDGMVAGQVHGSIKSCFKYLNGVFTTLPLPPKTVRCESAVTDSLGNITMTVVPTDNPNTTRLFELSSKGKFKAITAQSADGHSVTASEGGRMAGSILSPEGLPQAYLFARKGTGVDVGALTGMSRSWLTGVNAKGWAVGHGQAAGSNRQQAFLYKSGKITWLAPLTEGASAFASGINSSGVVVGSSESVAGDFQSYRAVTWQGKAAPISLGSLSGQFTHGAAINASGVVAGRYGMGATGMRARNGVPANLLSLILPEQQAQWSMVGMAAAINDKGLITGSMSGYIGNYNAAYLLRPLP